MPKKTKLSRPSDLEIELESGPCFVVKPYTRGQLREAIELDPDRGEIRGVVEASAQRALQLETLVGPTVRVKQPGGQYVEQPAKPILDKLTVSEEQEALIAILANGQGQDPTGMVAMNRLGKKKALLGLLIASADTTNKAPTSPPPSEGH
jgi:hypothetical protein